MTIVGIGHARKRGDDDPGAPSEDDFASSYEYFIEEIRAMLLILMQKSKNKCQDFKNK